MPDAHGDSKAPEGTLPASSLHAYGSDRAEDIEGDAEKLRSNDPQDQQSHEVESDHESDIGMNPPRSISVDQREGGVR